MPPAWRLRRRRLPTASCRGRKANPTVPKPTMGAWRGSSELLVRLRQRARRVGDEALLVLEQGVVTGLVLVDRLAQFGHPLVDDALGLRVLECNLERLH